MKRHGGTKKGAGKGCFGNKEPQHFDARFAGWIPVINKKGKRYKVFTEDWREEGRYL